MAEWEQKLPADAKPSGDHRLWVPMFMEALACGGKDEAPYIDLTPRYVDALARGDGVPLGYDLKPNLATMTSAQGVLGDPGVHLHWTLPAAFLHIRADDQNHKPVPNRWIVIRLSKPADEDGPPGSKAWIVDSDCPDQTDGAPWFDGRDSSSIGRVRELDKWTEQGTSGPVPLTAFAPANPAFAAFYPSSRNVFGFHDRDLPEGKTDLSYFVAGWFSGADKDPLVHLIGQSRDSWIKCMAELRWEVSEDTRSLPTSTICYAAIGPLQWLPDRKPDPNRQSRIAVGNGLLEAIAAISKTASFGELPALKEKLRNQLQFAALRNRRPTRRDIADDDSADSLFKEMNRFASLEVRLHERAFSALPGGTYWEIARKDSTEQPEKKQQESIAVLPPGISDGLARLNELQRQLDETQRRLIGARRDLFAAWHNYQSVPRRPGATRETRQARLANIRARIDFELKKIEDLLDALFLDALPQIKMGLEINKDRLREDLKKDVTFSEYTLFERAMPRFWRPNDPYILLAGIPVPEIQGGRSPLMCRVSGQTVSIFKATTDPGVTIEIDRDRLRNAAAPLLPALGKIPGRISGDINDLLLDVLFADPIAAYILAQTWASRLGGNPDRNQIVSFLRTIKAAQERIGDAARKVGNGDFDTGEELAIGMSGAPSKVALCSFLSGFNTPAGARGRGVFVPVFMLWEVNWHPAPREVWQLHSGGYDYRLQKDAQAALPRPTKYDGFAIVARNLERGFVGPGLEKTKEKFPDYNTIFGGLTGLLGQSLVGLTDALGMLERGPQFPLPGKKPDEELDEGAIKVAVEKDYMMAPLQRNTDDPAFFPVRGGHLRVTGLCLVDTFGRVQRIIDCDPADTERAHRPLLDPDINIARILAGGISPPPVALFPPRLVQPSRLLFRWVSGSSATHRESVGDLLTSPVCGWVIRSRLDGGLLVFDASGALLGMVQAIRGASVEEWARWSPFPPRPGQAATQVTDAEIKNQYMRAFVNGLLSEMGGAKHPRAGGMEFLWHLFDNIESRTDHSGEQGLQSILVGRPLALVRASLRLETETPPLSDQRAYLLPDYDPAKPPDFTQMRFPVRLGDRRLGADGLIGYFVDGEDPPVYEKIRLSAEQPAEDFALHPYFDTEADLTVACSGFTVRLSLLLDPKLGVHVVSGILPVNLVTLPPAVISAAMAALKPRFLVAPVLGEWDATATNQAPLNIPLPTSGKDEWSWYSMDASGTVSSKLATSGSNVGSPLFAGRALYEGWLGFNAPVERKQ